MPLERTQGSRRRVRLAAGLAAAAFGAAVSAEAKPARCFTSDDGDYACEFRPTGPDGSFEVSAPARPTFSLVVEEPGVALGFANFGSRNVALPGRYRRARDRSGCWINDTTRAKICAR